MKIIIIILLIIFMILLLRPEHFTNCEYLKIYDDRLVPVANYYPEDGKFLNVTTRDPIGAIEYNFQNSFCEMWGYVGAGIPELENKGDLFMNSNWENIIFCNGNAVGRKMLKKYTAVRITLKFN